MLVTWTIKPLTSPQGWWQPPMAPSTSTPHHQQHHHYRWVVLCTVKDLFHREYGADKFLRQVAVMTNYRRPRDCKSHLCDHSASCWLPDCLFRIQMAEHLRRHVFLSSTKQELALIYASGAHLAVMRLSYLYHIYCPSGKVGEKGVSGWPKVRSDCYRWTVG